MAQTLVKNYIHIVFGTKNRIPWFDPPDDKMLFGYIANVCKRLECFPISVGGYKNHVHILCHLSKNVALSHLVMKVKSNSSRFMRGQGKKYEHFAWQGGYAAFSVRPEHTDGLKRYIMNQKLHHEKKKFKTEYIALLDEHRMNYNEEFIWRE